MRARFEDPSSANRLCASCLKPHHRDKFGHPNWPAASRFCRPAEVAIEFGQSKLDLETLKNVFEEGPDEDRLYPNRSFRRGVVQLNKARGSWLYAHMKFRLHSPFDYDESGRPYKMVQRFRLDGDAIHLRSKLTMPHERLTECEALVNCGDEAGLWMVRDFLSKCEAEVEGSL